MSLYNSDMVILAWNLLSGGEDSFVCKERLGYKYFKSWNTSWWVRRAVLHCSFIVSPLTDSSTVSSVCPFLSQMEGQVELRWLVWTRKNLQLWVSGVCRGWKPKKHVPVSHQVRGPWGTWLCAATSRGVRCLRWGREMDHNKSEQGSNRAAWRHREVRGPESPAGLPGTSCIMGKTRVGPIQPKARHGCDL